MPRERAPKRPYVFARFNPSFDLDESLKIHSIANDGDGIRLMVKSDVLTPKELEQRVQELRPSYSFEWSQVYK